MIRTFFLGAAAAIVLAAAAQADGFEPRGEPAFANGRPDRVGTHARSRDVRHHRVNYARRHRAVGGVAPGRLTDNPNIPLYNVPPYRFP